MKDVWAYPSKLYAREAGILRASVKQNSYGYILPAIAFLVELTMTPTRLLVGVREPSGAGDKTERHKYYVARARKVDAIICFRVFLGLLAVFYLSQVPAGKWIVGALWLCITANVIASTIHYGLLTTRSPNTPSHENPANVLSIPRVILLSFVNYLEVIISFAAMFTTWGRFDAGTLQPLDSLYYSGLTIFTVGYGDIVPVGGTRLLAFLEVATGVFILTILVTRMVGSARAVGEYSRAFEANGGQATSTHDELWARIVAHQGQTFYQKRGGQFTYEIRGNAVYPDRTNRHIYRKNFEKALARVPFETTTVLKDLQAPSYVYAIMKDPRICG